MVTEPGGRRLGRRWSFSGDFVGTGAVRQNAAMQIRFDEYALDLANFALSHRGEPRPIEPQVFNLLLYLIKHRDRVIGRDELMDEIWSGKIVSDSTLSSCIKQARQALDDDARKQQYIATLNRRGYRFVGEVSAADEVQVESPSIDASNPFRSEAGVKTDKTSIAILPFNCRSNREEDEWLAEVVAEDLSSTLAQVPGFWVISQSTMQVYRGRTIDVSAIGRELGVQYLVEGNLLNVGGRYRISFQLMETLDNALLWADRHEFREGDLPTIENEIAARIVASIEPAINRAELVQLAQRRRANLSAWQLYRQSHAILAQKGWTEESFQLSADLLREAINRDADMACAHAYLSLVLALGDVFGLITEPKAMEEAQAAAETAVGLDAQDSSVLGFAGCALVDIGKLERGISLLRKAVRINPSNAQALAALGASLLKAGNPEGIALIQRGMRISPRDHRLAAWGTLLSGGLLACGRLDEALAIARDSCDYDDKVYAPRIVLAVASWLTGEPAAAREAIADARRIRPNLSVNDFRQFASTEVLQGMVEARLLGA